jgi:hypothetical protein
MQQIGRKIGKHNKTIVEVMILAKVWGEAGGNCNFLRISYLPKKTIFIFEQSSQFSKSTKYIYVICVLILVSIAAI